MPSIVLPHASSGLRDGVDPALGSVVLAQDQAIIAVVNGGLADDNISPSAAIQGTKLSAVAGQRVPEDRIEDDAVTADKLADSTTVDLDRAVTTNHIRDGAVLTAKIGNDQIIWGKIKRQETVVAFSNPFTIGAGLFRSLDLSLASPAANCAVTNPISGITAYMPVSMYLRNSGAPSSSAYSAEHSLLMKLYVDTASNKVWLILSDTQGVSINLGTTGYSIVIQGIALS